MTAIATDGITIAADGRHCAGTEVISDTAKKIIVRDGYIFATAGVAALCHAAIEWFLKNGDADDAPEAKEGTSWCIVVIGKDRRMYRLTDTVPYKDEFFYPQAFGSGADFARGAMAAGASPREAVELIVNHKLDTGTGGTVMEVNIEDALASFEDEPELMAAE